LDERVTSLFLLIFWQGIVCWPLLRLFIIRGMEGSAAMVARPLSSRTLGLEPRYPPPPKKKSSGFSSKKKGILWNEESSAVYCTQQQDSEFLLMSYEAYISPVSGVPK
jgi:hypothetical protein